MPRKQKQQQVATPTATGPAPKTAEFNYSAIPSSTKLWQVVEQLPPVPIAGATWPILRQVGTVARGVAAGRV